MARPKPREPASQPPGAAQTAQCAQSCRSWPGATGLKAAMCSLPPPCSASCPRTWVLPLARAGYRPVRMLPRGCLGRAV